MRLRSAVAALALFTTPLFAQEPTGRWSIEAGGIVDIAPAPSGGARRYEARWETPAGKYTGIGLVRDGRLSIGWGRGAAGVMVLKRDGAGWTGEWTTRSRTDEALGTESWPSEALEGEREVSGTRPDGQAYKGTVAVTKQGDVFAVAWTVGAEKITGVGLPLPNDQVAISFGVSEENHGAISYDLSGGDAVEGRWCANTDQKFGAEKLRRQSRDPAGTWQLVGGGTVNVTSAARGDRFTVAWDTPGGKYDGIGLVRRGRLLVGFSTAGVMLLRREGDGWAAEWTTGAQEPADRLGTETWSGSTLASKHTFEGVNPNGTLYRGEVEVTIKGDVYAVRWTVGDQVTTGIGLLIGPDQVAIAFGVNENPGVVAYDLTSGDTIKGRWAQLPVEKIGAEDLKR